MKIESKAPQTQQPPVVVKVTDSDDLVQKKIPKFVGIRGNRVKFTTE